ncbi:MAG: hypothetical protein WBC80_11895, partial [Isosphaeraceae bacterium]
GKGATGNTPQVFPRIRGSANRRVDLHLPLIASISGQRQGREKSLMTLEFQRFEDISFMAA